MYRIPDTCYSEKHVYELKRLWIQVAIDVLNEIALKEAGSPTRGQALLRGRTLALPKAMNMVITSTLSSLGSLRDALSQKYAALGRRCAHVGAPLLGVDVRDGRVAAVEFKPELFAEAVPHMDFRTLPYYLAAAIRSLRYHQLT